MMWGFAAHRVGVIGAAGQHKGLTAAAAEVFLFFITGAARLRHPVIPAITVEAERVIPDRFQTLLQHRRERHRQLARAVARQRSAFRSDAEENRSPAAHTAFRAFLVIVRGDEQQVGEVTAGGHFLPVIGDHLLGAGDLFPGRQ